MRASPLRVVALTVAAAGSAIAVWKAHDYMSGELGPAGGILGALVAALMLGSVVWIMGALLLQRPPDRPAVRRTSGDMKG